MYPQQDAPLVPPAVASIIGDRRVRRSIIKRYGLPEDLRLRDLDERVWRDFPPESIKSLARDVISATRESFGELAASNELVPIDPSGNGLSLRARNALFRAGLLGTPWTKSVSVADLAGEPGVGPKTLLEWLAAGAVAEESESNRGTIDLGAQKPTARPTRSRAVQQAAEALRKRRWASEIYLHDPRLGTSVATLRRDASNVREAAELLASDLFHPGAARVKARQLREFRAEAERLRRIPLHQELDEVLASGLDASESGRTAVMLRLGLGGQPPTTLAAAGDAVGVTRERVRQLVKRFIDAVGDKQPWTPVLKKVLKVVAEGAPVMAADAEQLLLEKRLVETRFSISSLLSAAQVFGLEAGFEYDHESGAVYRSGMLVSPRVVASEARRLTTHWGAATVDALRAELADRNGGEVDPSVLRILLESLPNFQWLDDEREWFWIKGTRRNRLLNQVEKIMSVAGSIEIGELREGAGRFHRMEGFRPPREVLARLCEQSDLYQRDGDLILEGPGLRRWDEVLGDSVEGRIAEALFEHGPIMRRDDLERIVVDERGVNRSSFYVYLGYSPIIARYAPGVYGLRGARVTAGEVNALIPPRVRTQRLVDHGWTADGRVWIGYRMSAAAVQAGVLSVPSALQEFVSGSYLLFSDQDRPIGTLVVKGNHMWGVGPFYRRWGVEEGDYVVVTIDINESRATIAAGSEEILLRFQEGE
jgi:hypothetical protein